MNKESGNLKLQKKIAKCCSSYDDYLANYESILNYVEANLT